MRLVDADKILHTHYSEQQIIGKDWDVNDLAAEIKLAPTIKAIPIEWFEEKLNTYKLTPNITDGIQKILFIWADEHQDE